MPGKGGGGWRLRQCHVRRGGEDYVIASKGGTTCQVRSRGGLCQCQVREWGGGELLNASEGEGGTTSMPSKKEGGGVYVNAR